MRILLPLFASLSLIGAPAPSLPAGGAVQVEIFEDIAAGKEFDLTGSTAIDRYTEPAFAFPHTPTKFASNAIPLDRSTPYLLRATYRRTLTAGKVQFRLRARGAAQFFVDGKMVAATKPQKPNTTSDDPVPPPVERGHTPLRPVVYPHQDSVVSVDLAAGEHSFELIAVVGGKGLYPSTGELAVSVSRNGEVDHLLGPEGSPLLIDAAWEAYVAASYARHYESDTARRRAVSREVTAAWTERHKILREKMGPAPAGKTVDGFIDARLSEAGAKPTAPLTDLEFLRRVTLDTTGLIPTPEQVRAFLKEDAAAEGD